MVYAVRDKSFKVDFVSNYVHERYQELVGLTYSLVDNASLDEILEIGKTDKVKAKELIKEVEKKRKSIAGDIIEIRRDIIKELVESNGISYDANWWLKRTAPDDINEFMLSCVRQDMEKSKPSKKK